MNAKSGPIYGNVDDKANVMKKLSTAKPMKCIGLRLNAEKL
jgi:hypothetical protein